METIQENISRLIKEYGDMVMRIGYTYMKNQADAEDVVQDVFLRVMEKQPQFQNAEHQKAWLIRTTINICKNKLNTFWQRNKCSLDSITPAAADNDSDTAADVLAAVLSLPENHRLVVYMYYYEGYSTREIAALLRKNHATVRSYLRRARNQLKDLLKEEYNFD